MKPLNDDLIDRVLARIEADPAAWNQRDFFEANYEDGSFCGTRACFAGHALLESGWTLEVHHWSKSWASINVRDTKGKLNADYDGEAAGLLGFTDFEASQVFFTSSVNTVAEMRAVIDRIRARRAEMQES